MIRRHLHLFRMVLVAIILSCMPTYGHQIHFSSLTTADGLSQTTVNDIYIDEYGMVWIGTNYGLNRYNGHSIEVFHNEKGNPNSIPDSKILRITGDRKGHLWMMCQTGISELDLHTMTFRTLFTGEARSIYHHAESNVLYACIGRKIMEWIPENNCFTETVGIEVASNINDMVISGSHMFIGTANNGTWKMNMNNHSLECIIRTANATRLYKDSKENIWIGTWQTGLYKYDHDGEVSSLRHDPANPNSLNSDFVRCCCEDETGKMWIGTILGLECYDPDTGEFTHYKDGNSNLPQLNHSSVWCTTRDNQGNIWIGTYYGGVNWLNPQYDVYTWHTLSATEGNGLSSMIIGCMVEDSQGNMWIATEGGGLNRLDKKTGKTRWYTKQSCGLSSDNIQSLHYDREDEVLWIGTHLGGLNRLDIGRGTVRSYIFDDKRGLKITQKIIKDIESYNDSLILATHDGVYMFDKSSGRRRKMFTDNDMVYLTKTAGKMFIDSRNNLWISIYNQGVICHDLTTGSTRLFRPSGEGTLSDANINSIIEDHNGKIWLSTSSFGLDMYDPETMTFTNFDKSNCGILSNRIYELKQSVSTRNILMTTSSGFCSFDPVMKKCINYDKANGFPVTDINDNSLYVTKDSTVFIGSIHGMVSFKEGTLNMTEKPYTITMSGLTVNGKKIVPKDQSGILTKTLPETRTLYLKSDISMFSIEFSTSNYLSANKCDVKYRLEGYSDEWHSAHGQNMITYSSIPPGRYRLVLRPTSHDESICPDATLDIRILRPWYKSWYSFLVYIILSIAIIYILLKLYWNSLQLKQSIIYEKKKSQDIEDLNQSKLRFFSYVSHEIRTPLTVIIAQIETLMSSKDFTPGTYKKVLSIYQNSVQLKGLISELLEFRKQELGKLKIKAGPHDIVKLVSEFYLVFDEYAKSKNISFTIEKETNHLEVWYDPNQLQKVFRNLISNAIKYTDAGGEIKIFLGMLGNDMIFKISDTGCGISKDEQENIFTNFYRVDRVESKGQDGTGIGLALAKGIIEQHSGTISVESTEGQGTTFIVTLPLGYSHFSAEQLEEESQNENSDTAEEIREEAVVPHRNKTMLIVDDNESIRNLLSEIFEPFYNIRTASDGEKGWETVQEELPDIVVSDVLMPKLSGTELCRKIKSEISTCHIPVVLLTARVDIDQNIEGILTGADDYIGKPFNTKLLISRCNNLVNSRIMLQEKFSKSPEISSKMLATNPIDNDILDRATSIIEQHMDDPDFNVNVFAHEMAMSRTNLFTKIKAITGQTPNDFVMTLRLKKAALLLKNNPELSAAEIADRTGFTSAKYFSKCFNDVYHMRPSAYRNTKEA